jgi:hypothetical protein
MALIDKNWTKVSINNVVSEFLRGERDTISRICPPWLPIIDSPNLRDPLENHKRLRLLYIHRANFWIEVPPDTVWHEVHSLTEDELDELYLSARHNGEWDAAGSRLVKVAAVSPPPLRASPDVWPGRIILWGHGQTGPFTILEGNHRMLAYAAAPRRPLLDIGVHIGLSESFCYWHFADPPKKLGNDLIKTEPANTEIIDKWLYRVEGGSESSLR